MNISVSDSDTEKHEKTRTKIPSLVKKGFEPSGQTMQLHGSFCKMKAVLTYPGGEEPDSKLDYKLHAKA